jgi:ribosomal-protein-alanine N-acetyltransferase
MSQTGLIFQSLREEDVDSIYAIESAVYPEPWTPDLFSQSLTAPMTYTIGVYTDRLIGYAIYQVIFTEAHILNIAVDPEFQAMKIGTQVLDRLIADAHKRGALMMYLEVRPTNDAAIALYRKRSFKPLMVRENYYGDGEAALIMLSDLNVAHSNVEYHQPELTP